MFAHPQPGEVPERDVLAEHIDIVVAGWTVVRLTSNLSLPACTDLERQLRPRLTPGARIAVDLRRARLHLPGCPSVLRTLQAEASACGAELVIIEADPVLRSELLLAGVVDVHASLDTAVHHGMPSLSPSLPAMANHDRRRASTMATEAAPADSRQAPS
jgi:hypothetical protein